MSGHWGVGHGAGMGFVGGAGLLVAILMLVAVGAIVYLAVRLANRDGQAPRAVEGAHGGSADQGTSARRILEDRLARGEIDTQEFRERVAALGDA